MISTESLIEDLTHWKTMYVSGRLHKPVSILILQPSLKNSPLFFILLWICRTGYSQNCIFQFQVKMLVQNENAKLRAALVSNLKSAVTASFLMLPESFSEEDLFLQIAGLSYAGNCCCITASLLLHPFNFIQILQIKLYPSFLITVYDWWFFWRWMNTRCHYS